MSAQQYLAAVSRRIDHLGGDQLAPIERGGELVAEAIGSGHRVWIARTTHCLHDEVTFRASGLMAVHILDDPITIEQGDVVVIGTNAGTTFLTVETAIIARERGAIVIVLTQLPYELHPDVILEHPSGGRLNEFADVLIDLGGQHGDGELTMPESSLPVLPGSGVAAMIALWMIFGGAVARLNAMGKPPLVWQSIQIPGAAERNAPVVRQYQRTRIGHD